MQSISTTWANKTTFQFIKLSRNLFPSSGQFEELINKQNNILCTISSDKLTSLDLPLGDARS